MADFLLRILHLVHSVEIILAFRGVGIRSSVLSFVPFCMKFALFVAVNSTRNLFDSSIPAITLDPTALRDFLFAYFVIHTFTKTKAVDHLQRVLKGPIPSLSSFETPIRVVHMILFAWFRLIAASKIIGQYTTYYWFSVFVVVLFLEMNGVVIGFLKNDFTTTRSTLLYSLLVALVVGLEPDLLFLLQGVLVYRHLIKPFIRH